MNRTELDRTVGAVRKAQELLGDSPGVADALAPALNVSFFLLDGHGYNFGDYLAAFKDPSAPPLGSFPTREDFASWLKTHFVPPPMGTVQIGGHRYSLGYERLKGESLLLRIPSAEELKRPGEAREQEPLWRALDQAQATLQSSPEDLEGLHSAALALHFIHEAGCAQEFAHFLSHFDEPLPPLCSFATREEADAWLMAHPSPPNGACVWIAEEEFIVGYVRERDQRLLVRAPPVEPFPTEE